VATTPLPGLSQVKAWSPDYLDQAATQWSSTATTWDDAYAEAFRQAQSPGGTVWTGDAADAAVETVGLDKAQVVGASDALQAAATATRTGSGELSAARESVLEAVSAAENAGFTVGEDYSVTPRQAVLAYVQAAQRAAAQSFAANIRAQVLTLMSTDTQVAAQITSAAAGLNDLRFGTSGINPNGNGQKPSAQLVDNRTFKQAPAPDPSPGGGSSPTPTPNAQNIQDAIKDLPRGTGKNIRLVHDPQQLKQLEDWINAHSTPYESGNPYRGGLGGQRQLPDGTVVRFGPSQKYGNTVDMSVPDDQVTLPDGQTIKLHIDTAKGGEINFPSGALPEEAPAEPAPAPRASVPEPIPEGGGAPLGGAPRGGMTEGGEGGLGEGGLGEGGLGGAGGFGGGGLVRPFLGIEPPI
jgi:hypothetical protein